MIFKYGIYQSGCESNPHMSKLERVLLSCKTVEQLNTAVEYGKIVAKGNYDVLGWLADNAIKIKSHIMYGGVPSHPADRTVGLSFEWNKLHRPEATKAHIKLVNESEGSDY